MQNLSADQAFTMVHSGNVSGMLNGQLSHYFKWAEAFSNCTVAEIKEAPLDVFHNIVNHATETMDKVRDTFRLPINVTCWYRGNIVHDRFGDKTHDRAAGGDGHGYHPQGKATDFVIHGVSCVEVYNELDKQPFMKQCGLEKPVLDGHSHVDSRGYYERFGPNT